MGASIRFVALLMTPENWTAVYGSGEVRKHTDQRKTTTAMIRALRGANPIHCRYLRPLPTPFPHPFNNDVDSFINASAQKLDELVRLIRIVCEMLAAKDDTIADLRHRLDDMTSLVTPQPPRSWWARLLGGV